MAVAVPIALELGELLASAVASKGIKGAANALFNTGARKSAEAFLMKKGKKIMKLAATGEGRTKILRKADKIGGKAGVGASEVVNFLGNKNIINAKLHDRFLKGIHASSKGFHSLLGAFSKVNKLSLPNMIPAAR